MHDSMVQAVHGNLDIFVSATFYIEGRALPKVAVIAN